MNEDYKNAIRDLIALKGRPVEISDRFDPSEEFDEYYNNPWDSYSTYGWVDHDADEHIRGTMKRVKVSDPNWNKLPSYRQYTYELVPNSGCSWVIPTGVEVREISYSEFTDTDAGNDNTVGINAYGEHSGDSAIHCTCGKYNGIMLRYQASLGEVLQQIFKLESKNKFTI